MNMLRNDFGGHALNEHFIPHHWDKAFWSDECTVERGIWIWSEYIFNRPAQQLKDRDVMRQPHRGT